MKYLFPFSILLILLTNFCSNPKKPVPTEIVFTTFQTNSSASLRGLFVLNNNTVWASGSQGTILLTTNGGENWEKIQVPGAEKNDFRSIHAWNSQRALVFGVAGPDFAYLTENGGNTWEVVYKDTTTKLFFNSLKFANDKTGLAISDAVDEKPFLIKTIDGGFSWKRIMNIPDAIDGEANFAASNTCIEFLPSGKAWIITGGTAARVFYSDDYGETWQVKKTPITTESPASGIFSISFSNDNNGVVVGGTYDKPELNEKIAAYTDDGGKTWNLSETMPAEYRSCVQSNSTGNHNFLIAIGKTGCDISLDNGKNWSFLSNEGYYTLKMIHGKSIGYAAGSEGRISKILINNL